MLRETQPKSIDLPPTVYDPLRDEPMPGVSPERVFLSSQENLPDRLDRSDLLRLAYTVNSQLSAFADQLEHDGNSNAFFTRLLTDAEAQAAFDHTVDRITGLVAADPSRYVVVVPMAGAAPIGRALISKGIQAVYSAEVSGSSSTQTGNAVVRYIRREVLEPDKTLIIADDIGDSWVTAIKIALERRNRRWQVVGANADMPYHLFMLKEFWNVAGEMKKNPNHAGYTGLHNVLSAFFINLFEQERTIPINVFDKHPTMKGALLTQANTKSYDDPGSWKADVHKLYAQYSGHIDDVWVMGGARMLDTGVPLQDIVERLPADLRHDSRIEEWLNYGIKLRLGWDTVGLVYFDKNGVQYDTLVRLAAKTLRQILTDGAIRPQN